ncbi:MAG: lipoyl synthase [Kiritimatiellaeota bacterium]|nr:lipoyl synthase [Kiritimatiellota bacterium]
MKPLVRAIDPALLAETQAQLRRQGLHSVCEGAQCPNIGECWARGHLTLMILGDRCTRGCRFCGITAKTPSPPDPDEPRRVAEAVTQMGMRHVVITSVTRDDLPDGGAAHWEATICAIRKAAPNVTLETLVPDFGGDTAAWHRIAAARPDILGHNLETVPRLYPAVRKGADYARSLRLLAFFADKGLTAKTSLMAGLGETDDELLAALADARAAGASIAFLGQYLSPTRYHEPVRRTLAPADFHRLRAAALALGFASVRAAPLLRSSTPPGVADR